MGTPGQNPGAAAASDLVFDGAARTITLNVAGAPVGTWSAGNNVAIHTPPGESGGKYTNGPILNGKYLIAPGDQNGATMHLGEPINGPYGAHGIIHMIGARGASGTTMVGAGVHAGRSGPTSLTAGCIRTTDAAMAQINATTKTNPVQTVTVTNNQPNADAWLKQAAAVKAAEE